MAAMGFSLLTQIAIARRLGASGLGEYNATGVFVMILVTVVLFGMPIALSERVSGLDESDDARALRATDGAFAIALLLGGIAFVACLLIWSPFVALAHLAAPAPTAVVAAAVLAAVLQSFGVNVLLARLEVVLATAIILLQPVTVAAGVIAVRTFPQLTGSQLLCYGLITSGSAALVMLLARGSRPVPHLDELRLSGRRAFPTTTVLYLTLLSGWLDRLVVSAIATPSSIATRRS